MVLFYFILEPSVQAAYKFWHKHKKEKWTADFQGKSREKVGELWIMLDNNGRIAYVQQLRLK